MLLCISATSILSGDTSLPYSEAEASRLFDIISHLGVIPKDGKEFDRSMSWVIGTLMKQSLFSNIYFQQPRIAVPRNEGVKIQHIFHWILRHICLLGILSTYENALEEICISGVISTSGWAIFADRLRQEASDSRLIATVLLNANVAFLAITSGHIKQRRFDYMSIVMSLASIVSGFWAQHAGWSNLRPQFVSQSWSWDFLVLSAMPLVCLIWAFSSFCAAVIFRMCAGRIPDYLATVICIGAFGVVYALFRRLSHSVFSPTQCSPLRP